MVSVGCIFFFFGKEANKGSHLSQGDEAGYFVNLLILEDLELSLYTETVD